MGFNSTICIVNVSVGIINSASGGGFNSTICIVNAGQKMAQDLQGAVLIAQFVL